MGALVSFILTAYNAKPYVVECIESCLNQTYSPIEVIVTDDGSGDNTYQTLLKAFGRHQSVSILHHRVNRGKVAGFNTSFAAAKGKFVAIVGADDFNYPDRISIEMEAVQAKSVAFVASNMDRVDQRGKLKESSICRRFGMDSDRYFTLKELIVRPCVFGGTILFRKQMGDSVFPLSLALSHEDHWLPLILCYMGKGYYIDRPLVCYRQLEQSNSDRRTDTRSYFTALTRDEGYYEMLLELVSREKFLDRGILDVKNVNALSINLEKIRLLKAKSFRRRIQIVISFLRSGHVITMLKSMPKILPFPVYYRFARTVNWILAKSGSAIRV